MGNAQGFGQRVDRDLCLQAASAAAAADVAVFIDDDMAEFAGDTAGTAKNLSVDSDAQSDADGKKDIECDAAMLRCAVNALCEHAEIGVVVHVDGQAEAP